jgi:hypothetical protein
MRDSIVESETMRAEMLGAEHNETCPNRPYAKAVLSSFPAGNFPDVAAPLRPIPTKLYNFDMGNGYHDRSYDIGPLRAEDMQYGRHYVVQVLQGDDERALDAYVDSLFSTDADVQAPQAALPEGVVMSTSEPFLRAIEPVGGHVRVVPESGYSITTVFRFEQAWMTTDPAAEPVQYAYWYGRLPETDETWELFLKAQPPSAYLKAVYPARAEAQEVTRRNALAELKALAGDLQLLRSWGSRLALVTPLPKGQYYVEGACRDAHGSVASEGMVVKVFPTYQADGMDVTESVTALIVTLQGSRYRKR